MELIWEGLAIKTLVFVPGALKGEDIFCQITSVKKNFAADPIRE